MSCKGLAALCLLHSVGKSLLSEIGEIDVSIGGYVFSPRTGAFKLVHCSGLQKLDAACASTDQECESKKVSLSKEGHLCRKQCVSPVSVSPPCVSLSFCLHVSASAYVFFYVFASLCLSACFSVFPVSVFCLSVSLSVFLSVCLPTYLLLSLCLSVCIFLPLPFRVCLCDTVCVSLWLERDSCGQAVGYVLGADVAAASCPQGCHVAWSHR